jgi:hypothetical protein
MAIANPEERRGKTKGKRERALPPPSLQLNSLPMRALEW